MRDNVLLVGCFAAILCTTAAGRAPAQQEVYHPGETYDSLQAGADAYWDAEAERRALIGRQVMLEEQIMAENTWANPQDRYRPVHPQSYGPILPQAYCGPTRSDVYADHDHGYMVPDMVPAPTGVVYYGGSTAYSPPSGIVPATAGRNDRGGYSAAAVPIFQPWSLPRVLGTRPNDIWGTPYYGYVRQPIGHEKIWTSRLGYIYRPIYASPPMSGLPSAFTTAPLAGRPISGARRTSASGVSPPWSVPVPPPPKPMLPPIRRHDPNPGGGRKPIPPDIGQEI